MSKTEMKTAIKLRKKLTSFAENIIWIRCSV